MKFLLIVLAIRFLVFLLTGRKKKTGMKEFEEDWTNPSEHNVWW